MRAACNEFLVGRTMTPNQHEFMQMMIEHLTEQGVVPPSRLYDAPYTDLHSSGLGGVFADADVDRIVEIVTGFQRRAAA